MSDSDSLDDMETKDRDFIAGLAKGLRVIECFDDENERLTIAEAAHMTGLTRAAARRSLHTLVKLGYMNFDGKAFTLTPRVLRLGYAFLESTSLPQLFQPFLEHLSEQIHESCSASVLDGDEIVYIARSATRRIMSVGLSVGSRLPAYCTSMGRVLLAGLPREEMIVRLARAQRRRLTPYTTADLDNVIAVVDQVREDGYAIIDQELEVGLVALAVPVISASGRVVAAINVGAQSQRISVETLTRDHLPRLIETQKSLRPLVKG